MEELREQYKAGYKPLELWCSSCAEKLQPTHAEVFAVEELLFRYVLAESTLEEFFQRIPTLV